MSADWDYAILAKKACEAGGPEALINLIKSESRLKGAMVGGAFVFGTDHIVIPLFKNYVVPFAQEKKEELEIEWMIRKERKYKGDSASEELAKKYRELRLSSQEDNK
jgi:hypothetical protein